jgi:hypothetical protein
VESDTHWQEGAVNGLARCNRIQSEAYVVHIVLDLLDIGFSTTRSGAIEPFERLEITRLHEPKLL